MSTQTTLSSEGIIDERVGDQTVGFGDMLENSDNYLNDEDFANLVVERYKMSFDKSTWNKASDVMKRIRIKHGLDY